MRKIHCINAISKYGTDQFTEDYELTDEVNEAEGILVRSASLHEMQFSNSLLAIARAGAGVNNIPLDACAQEGIVVFNTPGANANGVKELVLAGLFLASRDIVGGIEWCKENKDDANIGKTAEKAKKAFAGCEIKGKKLGVVGLGAIGAEVANAAIALGMEVYGYDPYISVNVASSRMMQKVPQADVIIRNPTHVAIALKYDPDHDNAPVVLAKGLDELALRIVKVGEENNVYTIENKPLARAMYNSCELDRPIPSEFYTAVAEILVYLYKQDNGKNKDKK